MNGKEDAEAQVRLASALSSLGEFYDTVQIFVTKQQDDGDTLGNSGGVGNWFARYGQIQEWLILQEERQRHHARKKSDNL